MIESSDGQTRAPASGPDRLALAAANATIGSAFTSQVMLRDGEIALQEGERRLSYRQLNERVNRLANHMLKLGVNRGDRIALLSENRCEFVEVELAAAKLGVITACLNWRQADRELSHGIYLVDPMLIVTSERYVPTLARLGCEVPHKLTLGEEYERALARANDAGEPPPLAEAEDGLVILYTSGTTGMPKAAVVSHRAMIFRMLVYALDRPLAREDSYVAWGPLFHMGSTDSTFATLLRGGKVIIVDGFDAAAIAAIVATEQLGMLHLNSAVIDRLLDHMKRNNLQPKGMKEVGVMADLVPRQTIAELTALMNAPMAIRLVPRKPDQSRQARGRSPSVSCRTDCQKCKAHSVSCASWTTETRTFRTVSRERRWCARPACSAATGAHRTSMRRCTAADGFTWATSCEGIRIAPSILSIGANI